MNVLLLGGTGAIGNHLADLLSAAGHHVSITTRSNKNSKDGKNYITGNAKEVSFLNKISNEQYDCVVDFMMYSTKEFSERQWILLGLATHYVYISSARVFAESPDPITESSPRLLDVTQDDDYLATDEYALTKARQEDMLKSSSNRNWTIARPYITYGENRLQLLAMEKEDWLQRAINGKKVVYCNELGRKKTTMTYGSDVAMLLYKIILLGGTVFGDTFNLTSQHVSTWNNILEIYSKSLVAKKYPPIKVVSVELNDFARISNNHYPIIFDRRYDRTFDNTKARQLLPEGSFKSISEGIQQCMYSFLDNQQFDHINPIEEAKKDKITNEYTSLFKFEGVKNKLKYIKYRISK